MGLKIEPQVVIIINNRNMLKIELVIRDILGNIIYINSINAYDKDYNTRHYLIKEMSLLLESYKFDTIILQQTELLTDSAFIYPDYNVLQNVKYKYSIQIAIEDYFFNKVKYILALPAREWQETVLGKRQKYSIDKYKSHFESSDYKPEIQEKVDKLRCYELICLSESINYKNLLDKKYLVNI